MDIGIAVVSWNVRDLLAGSVSSALADLERSGLTGQVWVVDNGSQDGSEEMVRERFPQARLLENGNNPGFGAANNQAFREMGFRGAGKDAHPETHFKRIGEWGHPFDPSLPFAVLCLNPDAVVLPGAIRTLYAFLKTQPRAGLAGARLLNSDGTLQHGAFRYPGVVQAALDLFPPLGRLARLLDSPFNGRYPARSYGEPNPFRVDYTLGAAFMVRGEALAQSGGFDESFRLYCEEIDWAWRLERLGWERWLHPAAQVVHLGGRSTSQAKDDSLRALWLARRQLYGRYRSPLVVAITGWLVRTAMRRRARRAASAAEAENFRAIAAAWRA